MVEPGKHMSVYPLFHAPVQSMHRPIRFPWALQIPEYTLPRERGMTGAVTHYVEASAIGAGFVGSTLRDETEINVVHGYAVAFRLTV